LVGAAYSVDGKYSTTLTATDLVHAILGFNQNPSEGASRLPVLFDLVMQGKKIVSASSRMIKGNYEFTFYTDSNEEIYLDGEELKNTLSDSTITYRP
jgi:hypothetical protein